MPFRLYNLATDFLVLNDAYPDAETHRHAIVRQALNNRKTVSRDAQTPLRTLLKSSLNFPGFRNPYTAPTQRLISTMNDATWTVDTLWAAVLSIWAETEPDLRNALRDFLEAEAIPTITAFYDLQQHLPAVCQLDEAQALWNRFQEQHSAYPIGDIACMFTCLTGAGPVDDGRLDALLRDAICADDDTIWSDVLDTLDDTPQDDGLWAQLPDFKAAVTVLAEHHAHLTERLPLSDRLVTLAELPKLAYFSLSDVPDWSWQHVAADQVEPLTEAVDNLVETIQNYHAQRQIEPRTAQERRRISELLEAQEEHIFTQANTLRTQLSDAQPLVLNSELGKQVTIRALRDWLDTLTELPTEASEWATATHLLTALQRMIDQHEQYDDHLMAMRQTITAIAERADATGLEDFGFKQWSVEQLPATRIASYRTDLERLLNLLETDDADAMLTQREHILALCEQLQNDLLTDHNPIDIAPPESDDLALPQEQATAPYDDIDDATQQLALVVADALQNEQVSDEINRLFNILVWRLLAEHKHGSAYQLLHLADDGRVPITADLPAWLVEVTLLGREVRFSSDEHASRLKNAFEQLTDADFEALDPRYPIDLGKTLLLLASSLRPALLAPLTSAGQILRSIKTPHGLETLHEYRDAIGEFAQDYQALDIASLAYVKDETSWQAELEALQADVQLWRDKSAEISFGFQPALVVWQQWHIPNGFLDQLLLPILNNDMRAESHLRAILNQYLSSDEQIRELALNHYNSYAKEKGRITVKSFEPRPMGSMCNRTQDVATFVSRWLELLDTKPGAPSRYGQQRTDTLQRKINALHEPLLHALERFTQHYDELPIQAAVEQLWVAVENIDDLFNPETPLPGSPKPVRAILNEDWLRMTFVATDENWQPYSSDSYELLVTLLQELGQEPQSWQDVYADYLDAWNHQATAQVIDYLTVMGAPQPELAQLQAERRDHLLACRDALQRFSNSVASQIERAVEYGLVTEEKRHNFQSIVLSIQNNIQQIDDFHIKRQQLREIEAQIQQAKEDRRTELRRRLEREAIKFADGADRELLDQALKQGDMVTAAEYIEILKEGRSLQQREQPREIFNEYFPEAARKIEQYLEQTRPAAMLKNIANQRAIPGADMRNVPGAQAAEAERMMRAWLIMKRQKRASVEHLHTFLSELGFPITLIEEDEQQERQTWFNVQMTPIQDRERSPISVYGSEARGFYRILCMWGRPPEDRIVDEIGTTGLDAPTIVLYFGRMTETRSRELAQLCRERRRTFIVVDEKVVLFLCGERGTRLPALFHCTLPFTFHEPYNISSGVLPPEMFFGRAREKQALMNPFGSCFLYGGRQLGKTVLLRAVEHEFHNPEQSRVALWLDLKAENIGYGRPIHDLWRVLASYLQAQGVVDDYSSDPQTLLSAIGTWLEADPRRRVLLLIDEADRFLEVDGESGFQISSFIKGWMDRTERRLKVVFSGLHNVLRTTTQANHPLAHYGEPICIGPLLNDGEWREARNLIELPLKMMGYVFEDGVDVATRILSQTNYYPSLIQIYCNKLLNHINNRPFDVRHSPPHIITSQHVEAVYHHEDLRDLIRERFKLTLQLDERYAVVANVIARQTHLDSEKGAVEGYDVSWIRREALYFWPEGFRQDSSDDAFRVLLQEMEGLGILRLAASGQYALRSPNVSLLMGRLTEIEAALLQERTAPTSYTPAQYRATFAEGRCSPLTAQQETALRRRANGITMIFGTEAAGLSDVVPYLRHAFQHENFFAIENTRTQAEFEQQLHQAIGQRTRDGTTLLVIADSCDWDEEWITAAYQKLQRLPDEDAYVRVVFLADPDKARQLIDTDSELLDLLRTDDNAMSGFSLGTWHTAATQRWLLENNYAADDLEAVHHLKRLTGYWPYWLDLFQDLTQRTRHNWPNYLPQYQARLWQSASLDDHRRAFGLTQVRDQILLTIIAEMGTVTADELQTLSEMPHQSVRCGLRWAELLRLVSSEHNAERGTVYQLDPSVALLLQREVQHD